MKKAARKSQNRFDHDKSYKQLFSHPEMVRDLLVGFVEEPWVQQIDFSTLERVNNSYVSDDMREREDDVVWRVRFKGAAEGKDQWIYVYLLIEFQSTIEPFMAVRMLVYVALLYQDLVRGRVFTPSGKLPPVLPLVLYNGAQKWSGATEIADLIAPLEIAADGQTAGSPDSASNGPSRYQPKLKYLLLEENQYSQEELEGRRNPVAAMFRLENGRTPGELLQTVDSLSEWLTQAVSGSILADLTRWVRRVIIPSRMARAEGKHPEGVSYEEIRGEIENTVRSWEEMRAMLAERVREWDRQAKINLRKGREQGLEEGRREGEVAILLRQLDRRFGPLSESIRERVTRANAETLLEWGDRLLDARTIEDVMGDFES